MKKIEILSPCGGFDSVVAAVRSGADAVYLGAKELSARAGAENFDDNEMKTAVEYCHIRGVLVYVTVNTIIFDNEIEKAKSLIISCAKAGVDALIVQNIGLAMLAKKIAPELPLHASTQMSVHSPSGAKLLYEQGFKRVVLARELSRDEIKEIAESCPIELEVFVHGALCMSVSGQCYFSAVIGSRSGNRGRCAQTCRLPFSIGKSKYALSLKDNSIIDHIRDLQEIGVTSAKIEGRLKRPEYVAVATKACKQSRDDGFVSEETRSELENVFSRTGFTDGYYTSKRGYEMFGYRRKDDVVSATEKLFKEIRADYKDEAKRVDITAEFSAKIGGKAKLVLSDGTGLVEINSEEICEKALNAPLTEEKIGRQLLKTGGTPYNIVELKIDLEDNLIIKMSVLNKLRRDALDLLSEKRSENKNYTINEVEIPKIKPHVSRKKLRYARVNSENIGNGFSDLDLCFVPINSDTTKVKKLVENGFKLGVEIPRAMFSREKAIKTKLAEFKNLGIKDALCNNLAAVYIAKESGLNIHGGFGLNFTNTLDLLWAESMGFADTELSFEIKLSDAQKLGADIPRGVISFGYLPVMLTRNCPNKSADIKCSKCSGKGKMKDRLGKTFIFYCDGFATEVLNNLPLEEINEVEISENLDISFFRFSVENYVENVEKWSDFISESLNSREKTHGLLKRGVL